MKRESGPQLDAFAVDVRALLERSVASLYSHLVTRPTGRAVRMAIETQLEELKKPAISLVDLSAVAILDYSCADEVVAKLLLRAEATGGLTYFVLGGVRAHHREPIEAVLERHDLAIVAETSPGSFELLGAGTGEERRLWGIVQDSGWVASTEVDGLLEGVGGEHVLGTLLARRLLFRDPRHGDLHALSTLAVAGA
jgi:hypothetical protein